MPEILWTVVAIQERQRDGKPVAVAVLDGPEGESLTVGEVVRALRRTRCPLSRPEVECLEGLAAGLVYCEIADQRGCTESTVRTHLHNLYTKIGAFDRAQAVLIAQQEGWISRPTPARTWRRLSPPVSTVRA